jgi:hypothetical protein
VPDSSPWITYDGSWVDANTKIGNYADDNAHYTNARDAKATITFTGTSVQVFGAKRDDHGKYSVTLDGTLAGSYDGRSALDMFKQPLYTALSLPMGLHTVVVTNLEEGQYLDIDYVSIEVGDGKTG